MYLIAFLLFTLLILTLIGLGMSSQKSKQIPILEKKVEALRAENSMLLAENSKISTQLTCHQEAFCAVKCQHAIDLETNKKLLSAEFELLSQKILKSHSEDFSQSSKTTIESLIEPFKGKLEAFGLHLETVKKSQEDERLTLKVELKSIAQSNALLATQTEQLTQTLRGDIQKQGAWGELVLERVLEASGLRKGHEYLLHGVGLDLEGKEGQRQYPDVVINLPDKKHLVIDAKFPYINYEGYLAASGAEEKEQCLKALLQAVQNHIKNLGQKKYASSQKLNTPTLVLLFIPIEAIFSLVMQSKPTLFEEAWAQSIVLVSPSNLLAILRTVESLWKVDLQNKNVQEIAVEGARLYDKFCNLLSSLDSLRASLDNALQHHQNACAQISGRGGLTSKVQKLKELGLKTKNSIPEKHLPDQTVLELEESIEEVVGKL